MLLQYDIAVVGLKNVDAALASLERRFVQHNQTVNRTFRGTSGGSGGSRCAPVDQSFAKMGRGFAGIAKAAELQQRAELRAAQKLAREKERLEEQAFKRKVQLQNRYFAQEQRHQERQERIAARRIQSEAKARETFVKSTLGNTASRVGGAARAVGATGAAMIGIGGAALAASSVSQAMKLDERARRLAIQGRDQGQPGADPNELRRSFSQIGIATGRAPEEVAAGASAYVTETGDLKTAMANLRTFATVAQAADSSVEDIARASAHMGKIGIKSIDEVKDALATLSAQGKKGAFELKNMASEFPEILSQAAQMGIRGTSGLRQLGGLLQVVQKSTGNASETTTATSNVFRQLIAKSADLESGKELGKSVKVFKDKGHTQFRDFRDVFGDVLEASKGDLTKLNDLFEIRGSKAFNPFTTTFNETRASALKGGATQKEASARARTAALGVLDQAANVPTSFAEVERDANDAMKSASVQFDILNAQLKEAVASQVFPELIKLTPELKELVPAVGDAARMFVSVVKALKDHPFLGLGALIGGSIVYEIGKAKLGALVATALTRAIARVSGGGIGGIGGAGGGAASGGGAGRGMLAGALGAAGLGLAAGLPIAELIYTRGVSQFEKNESRDRDAGADLNYVRGAGLDDLSGVREAFQRQKGRVEEAAKPGNFFESVGLPSVGRALGFNEADVSRNFEQNALAEMAKKLSALDQLNDIAQALKKAGASQEQAATRLSDAARRLGVEPPNRGNGPSSPKLTSG